MEFTFVCKELGVEVTEQFYSKALEESIGRATAQKPWITVPAKEFIHDMFEAWVEGRLTLRGNNTGEDLCKFIHATYSLPNQRKEDEPLSLNRIRSIFYEIKG